MPEHEPVELLRAAQRRAAELLEREYARLSRPADVARVIELGLELLDDPAEKTHSLEKLTTLRLDQLDDQQGAFEALCTLVRIEPHVARHRARAKELPDSSSPSRDSARFW